MPHTLREAVELLRQGKVARKFFGDAVVEHYDRTGTSKRTNSIAR